MEKRILLLGLSILLLVLPTAVALICTDSDKGPLDTKEPLPYATTIGTTKDSNTTKTDTCVDKKNGLPSTKGMWLREYFCEDNKVKSTEYMCLSLNYDECNQGRCAKFGEKTGTTQKLSVSTNCGNKKLEKGEDCDPPDKLCIKDSYPGLCSNKCECILVGKRETDENGNETNETEIKNETGKNVPEVSDAASKPADTSSKYLGGKNEIIETEKPICGDGKRSATEECETDLNCALGRKCFECICKEQQTTQITGNTVKEGEFKKFDESFGIRITRAVSNTAKKLVRGIWSLFG